MILRLLPGGGEQQIWTAPPTRAGQITTEQIRRPGERSPPPSMSLSVTTLGDAACGIQYRYKVE
jgi:hypothetical protein